jgi:uncharacterized protein
MKHAPRSQTGTQRIAPRRAPQYISRFRRQEKISMALRERFNDALKEAMKSRAQRRVSTLRLVLAALKERDIANRSEESRAGIGEEEILSLLTKMIRQREESASTFDGGGRPELAAAEREEIAIIREFMPRQMDEAQMKEAAERAIAETGAASIKDMGRVMSVLKERHAGEMDFGKAGAAVKTLLSGK